MQSFPTFIKLANRRVLVVGGDDAAIAKTRLLLSTQANITIVCENPEPQLQNWSDQGRITLHQRQFHTDDLYEIVFTIIATGDLENNRHIAELARQHRVLVNVVDRPALSDFTMPAIVERGPVTVAISTGGAAPVLSRQVRGLIETALPKQLGALAAFIDHFRDAVKSTVPTVTGRRKFWDRFLSSAVARAVLDDRPVDARREMLELLNRGAEIIPEARIVLIGGSNHDPDLVTRQAHRLLQQADTVLHTSGVSPDVVDLARRDARRVTVSPSSVGNHVNALPALTLILANNAASLNDLANALSVSGHTFDLLPGVDTPTPHQTLQPERIAAL